MYEVMFEFIDKVVYINLDHREDRRTSILKQLEVFPSEKVIRFPAIREENGAIGCTKSHIAVLEMAIANKWKNVLILEDDAIWNKFDEGYSRLEKLVQNPYDVIVFGSTLAEYDKETFRLTKGHTTTAYLVSNHYYEPILGNFKYGLKRLVETGIDRFYAIDRFWQHLQIRDKWYCIIPCLMYQTPSWSDILGRVATSCYNGINTFEI
jgi:glycosyl transferase family 25